MEDKDNLLRRAYAAYFRGGGMDQPSNDSTVETVAGKDYIVLKNANGILAVYRVRNNGLLKGLKRWPKELDK